MDEIVSLKPKIRRVIPPARLASSSEKVVEVGGGSRQAGVAKVGITGMCEDVAKKEANQVAKNPEETLKYFVPEDELYESSSESDQETQNVKECAGGLGSLNLGAKKSEYGPGDLNLGVGDAWRSPLQVAPTNLGLGAHLSLGAVPRELTHSPASSTTSTLPVSPPSGFHMNPAPPSTEVSRAEMAGRYNRDGFGKRDELLFPSTSPVLTSAISSTLFTSSISSLRSSSGTEREVERQDQSVEEQQRIWDTIQRRRIEERRRLKDEEEHLRLAEEQERILEDIKRKEKERKTEEELSMNLILQITSRERQVPAAAPSSQNQSVKSPPQQMQRGITGGWAKVDEVLGWHEVKRNGRGESQGRSKDWPPLETSEPSFKGELGLSSSGSQRAGGLRGIGQDMSKSERKGFKSNYKTVLCEPWNTTGRCQYGAGCHFAHGESELKRQQREVNRVQQMQQQRKKKEGREAGGTALKSEEQRRAADKNREELKRREEEEVMKQWEAATRRVAGVSAQNQASKGKSTSRRHPGL